MKLKNLFWGALASLAVFAACEEPEQNLGTPDIGLSVTEMTFDTAGGEQTLTVTATRDWMVETDADWVVVSPESGSASADAQTVTVSVLENTGLDREVDLKFTIGMKSKYLTVSQAGPGGSAEALVVYSNNFDISKAQNNSGWPYLDSNYDLWDNKTGTGASTVDYAFGGKMSVRTSGKLSNDGSGYSHYAGSGMNKVFFGAATSIFKIQNITLDAAQTNYALSFGGQRYTQDDASNLFSFDEFKVYVSNDAAKWVPVTMAFPADADLDGDWNLASAKITLPSGTAKLSIAFVCTKSSAYSIDDVLLEVAGEAGQAIETSYSEIGSYILNHLRGYDCFYDILMAVKFAKLTPTTAQVVDEQCTGLVSIKQNKFTILIGNSNTDSVCIGVGCHDNLGLLLFAKFGSQFHGIRFLGVGRNDGREVAVNYHLLTYCADIGESILSE